MLYGVVHSFWMHISSFYKQCSQIFKNIQHLKFIWLKSLTCFLYSSYQFLNSLIHPSIFSSKLIMQREKKTSIWDTIKTQPSNFIKTNLLQSQRPPPILRDNLWIAAYFTGWFISCTIIFITILRTKLMFEQSKIHRACLQIYNVKWSVKALLLPALQGNI